MNKIIPIMILAAAIVSGCDKNNSTGPGSPYSTNEPASVPSVNSMNTNAMMTNAVTTPTNLPPQ